MSGRRDPGLARLVDGVLLPGFDGTRLPDWLARRIEGGLAGVCYFGHNVASAAQVAELSAALHAARPAVLVASDEEGGDVTRLEAAEGSSWPGNAALGALDDVAATQGVAAALARQVRAAGVDLALAPVVDVNVDPDNPVIGIRSFGAEPALVARHAAAFVRGVQSQGVAACAKHYPGHGDTSVDSHLALPVVDVDLETLRSRDLPPFAAAVDAGVRAVLTAHVRFPALDDAPATLSAPVLSLLREELGFTGVVVSDALDMRAISAGVGRGRGAVLALRAGVDLLCIGNPRHPERYADRVVLDEVSDTVLSALDAGELSVARLEEAAGRVAELAGWLARGRTDGAGRRGAERDAGRDHAADGDRELGLAVARRVVACGGDVRLDGAPHVLDLRGEANVAAGRTPLRLVQALRDREPATTCSAPPAGRQGEAMAHAAGRPLVVVVDAPHRDPRQGAALSTVLALRPDAVVADVGLPDRRADLGDRWLRTWGGARVNAEAAAEVLVGR